MKINRFCRSSNRSPAIGSIWTFLILPLLVFISACTFVQPRYPGLPPGPYRAILKLENNFVPLNPRGEPTEENMSVDLEELTEGQLPFNFEVIYDNDTSFHIDLYNGEETIHIPAEHISYGRDQSQGRDTIRIDFPVYDSHISAYHEENVIEGVWVVHYRDNYRIPLVAQFGQDHRFTTLRKEPAADLSGRWAVTFSPNSKDAFPGLAEFVQNGNELRGTFLTETGDYRYLAGTVQADRSYLSVFDGSHAFLFEAAIAESGDSLRGSFRSGRHYKTDWIAWRADADYELADPDTLTRMVDDGPLSFRFSTSAGRTVSLDDPAFDDKVKLVQLFGSWCPNCRDETAFLRDWLKDFERADEIAVIGLGFERYGGDDPRSRAALDRYQTQMGIDWPLLLAGSSSKQEAAEALPQLDRVLSFPTLLFVDRHNHVRRIHTGFNGPATSEYATFRSEFEQSVKELLNEISQ